MRVLSVSWVVFLFASLLSTPSAAAQERTSNGDEAVSIKPRLDLGRESEQLGPPAPPLPWARASMRSPIPDGEMQAVTAAEVSGAPGAPGEGTVVLPLSAGLSVISLPLRVESEKLSDLFPNLPEGSRAWIWDVSEQEFVEGLDSELPLGHACFLYVPFPVLLIVTGRPNLLQDVSVDLEKGWNLIGVPYGTALLRSEQQVYVDWARKPFNDAVAANALGPVVYSFDENGYETVDEDGSFEPLRGYWVYASRAELLELRKPGFSEGPGLAIPWGTVLQYAGTTILTQMGYGDSAKLNQILADLDNISQTQAALNSKLDTLITQTEVLGVKILQAFGDTTYVAPVQVALTSHYDELNPTSSLAWFAAQAEKGAGPSVSMATKSNFARQVLNEWQFIDKFNLIRAGITPVSASDKGLLDNYADHILLTSGEAGLKQHYLAMEAYFSTLLGMQIKCANLIMGAYDQLGNDPASTDGYTPQSASDWKANVFNPVIREETERFLHVVERMAVTKIPVPQTWTDPPVKLPDNVQVVMGLADLYFMETLRQIYPSLVPPGIRVRIVLNPGAGANLPKVSWLVSLFHPHFITLPSIDTWRTCAGTQDYDNWSLNTDTPAFTVTKDWKIVQVILPVTKLDTAAVGALWEVPWYKNVSWSVSPTLTESETLFGAITFAIRPTANDVFNPCSGWPITTDVTQFCSPYYMRDCDQGGVDSCNSRSFHPTDIRSALTMTYEFTYQGEHPIPGTWKFNGEGAVTQNPYCDWSLGTYEFVKGTSTNPIALLDSTVMTYAGGHGGWGQTVQLNWEPHQTYVFRVTVQPYSRPKDQLCVYYWTYQGAQMTFPFPSESELGAGADLRSLRELNPQKRRASTTGRITAPK